MAVELTWEMIEKEEDMMGLPAPSGISGAKVLGGWLI